jgi:hypothetical protein
MTFTGGVENNMKRTSLAGWDSSCCDLASRGWSGPGSCEPRRAPPYQQVKKKSIRLHSSATIAAQRRTHRQQRNGGVRMSYTLAAAAAATGLDQSTILKAIKDGKVAGTRDERGEWHVEAAELHLAYPPLAEQSDVGATTAPYAGPDIEALGAQIEALLRQAGARLRQQLDDTRSGRDPTRASQLQFADQSGEE